MFVLSCLLSFVEKDWMKSVSGTFPKSKSITPLHAHFCFTNSLLICSSEFSWCFVWMGETQTKAARWRLETLSQEKRRHIPTNQPRLALMTGVISQFSASTGRGCWWATDVLNHRKRWCDKKQERAKTLSSVRIPLMFQLESRPRRCVCVIGMVHGAYKHTPVPTHILPCCYKRWTLSEVSVKTGR